MNIHDASGGGNGAGVTKNNQLRVLSSCVSLEHYMNVMKGSAFSIISSKTPSVSGGCTFYMKNLETYDIIIEQLEIFTNGDQIVDCSLSVEGTPVDGASITPANNNSNSASSANGTFLTGSNITGLSNGNIVSRFKIKGDEQSRVWNFPCDLVVGKNRTFSICCDNANIETNINLSFYYDYDGVSS